LFMTTDIFFSPQLLPFVYVLIVTPLAKSPCVIRLSYLPACSAVLASP